MNELRTEPHDKETVKASTLFRIVPAGLGQRISSGLDTHTQEMVQVVKKILKESALDLENTPQFWDSFLHHAPIVHWEPCRASPGGVSVYLLARALNNYDMAHFFTEMVVRWLIPGKQATILRTKQLTFRFVDVPNESFFVAELFALVDDERALSAIQKNMPALAQEIALGASSVHHARQILVTKALTQEQKTTLIHKTIVEISNRKYNAIGADALFEMHHFLLASDDEFKRIRDVRHMCRIILCHNWFRKQISQATQTERQILVKPMPTNLHFQFGEKNVVGLVVGISFLREYEQFEARHIASACQRILPHISVVPRSFFCYQNSQDPVYCFYLEIEKRDGKKLSLQELSLLKEGLVHEIPHSIEQLSHTLFMPQNEEEIMRNIMLLSQEIRYVRDIPQMIITFQGQSDESLRFHVTLIRVAKETIHLENLFSNISKHITFISGSSKVIGQLRNKYPKEALTFLLECKKSPFLRLDHSVDLSRAREFITQTIWQALGVVRDFNGGLMSQQNQLLNGIKELLNSEERKEEMHLENLFHSLEPVLMRSLLPPELIKRLFCHFLILHNGKTISKEPSLRESFEHNAYASLVCTEDAALCEELHKAVHKLDLKEQELAYSRMSVDGLIYQSFIFSASEQEKLLKFQELIHKTLNSFSQSKKEVQSIRISLPRPTSSLDPRIGTDRTSGIVIKMLYDGLMRIDPTGNPSCAVASGVSISPDQKRYLFILRKSNWTNGKPVTAHDFEYAWKKVLDPQFRAPFAYLFYPIKNAKSVKLGQKPVDDLGVYVRDDYSLEVELEHPAPYFLEHCAHWIYSPLCKEVDQIYPGWAYYGDDTYVSNGPFRLSQLKQNSGIQVLKNPLYWDHESVQLKEIDISIVEDPNRALQLFQRGELDWIGEPLSEIPPDAFKMDQFDGKIFTHPIAAVHWYSCNLKLAPFSSKKCRKALAIALNRKEIINKLFHWSELPAYSILPPGLSGYADDSFSDGNSEQAITLFKEGLAELGLTQSELAPIMITCCDQEIHYSIAEAVSKKWKEVLGLETKIETFKWDRFMEKCWQRDFQIMGMTWYSWVYDPSYNLEHLQTLAHEMNFAQWHNPTYTDYLNKAQSCIDHEMRRDYFRRAEEIVMEEIPVIPLFYYSFKYMKKETLEKIYLSHLGQIDFKWAQINE